MKSIEAEAKELLKKTRELLTDPTHWTQGFYAKNEHGESVPSTAYSATCWCAIGAMEKVWDEMCGDARLGIDYKPKYRAQVLLGAANDEGTTVGYNDTVGRTHEEVLAWFDRAIEKADQT